ncbi:MAG: response regulator [Anaerolineae bacterium]
MKVLYVEDEPSLREEVALILELEEYQVETAENGIEGLEKVKSFNPDIVLTDMRMPKMNGEEMLVEIRHGDNPDIPVILISAFVTSEWSDRLTGKGASAYLTKPFSIDDLINTIQQFQ